MLRRVQRDLCFSLFLILLARGRADAQVIDGDCLLYLIGKPMDSVEVRAFLRSLGTYEIITKTGYRSAAHNIDIGISDGKITQLEFGARYAGRLPRGVTVKDPLRVAQRKMGRWDGQWGKWRLKDVIIQATYDDDRFKYWTFLYDSTSPPTPRGGPCNFARALARLPEPTVIDKQVADLDFATSKPKATSSPPPNSTAVTTSTTLTPRPAAQADPYACESGGPPLVPQSSAAYRAVRDSACYGVYSGLVQSVVCEAPVFRGGSAYEAGAQYGVQPARKWCGQRVSAGWWVQQGSTMWVWRSNSLNARVSDCSKPGAAPGGAESGSGCAKPCGGACCRDWEVCCTSSFNLTGACMIRESCNTGSR